MKKFRIIAATTLVGAALIAGTALPAAANSHSGSRPGGGWNYADQTDTYCVKANGVNGSINVKLTPLNPTRGVVRSTHHSTGDSVSRGCTSLAQAYEDTKYRADVTTWYNGKTYSHTYYFWS